MILAYYQSGIHNRSHSLFWSSRHNFRDVKINFFSELLYTLISTKFYEHFHPTVRDWDLVGNKLNELILK